MSPSSAQPQGFISPLRSPEKISRGFCANVEAGKILQEIQAGYMLGDRLLRPALVSVSKKKTHKTTEKEEKMKVLARRSVIALDDIEKDEVFTDKNIGARRPGNGLPPTMIESIVGLKAKQEIVKGKLITQDDFGEENENI